MKPKNMRQQVAIENRRRTIVFFTLILVALVYLLATLLLGDMGLFKYLELKKTKQRLETEILSLDKERELVKSEVEKLRIDQYYIEKTAREEYGMAKPNELIFQFKDGR